MLLLRYNGSVKREYVGIRKSSALDAFQMFYEEIVSAKVINDRIRRLRKPVAAK